MSQKLLDALINQYGSRNITYKITDRTNSGKLYFYNREKLVKILYKIKISTGGYYDTFTVFEDLKTTKYIFGVLNPALLIESYYHSVKQTFDSALDTLLTFEKLCRESGVKINKEMKKETNSDTTSAHIWETNTWEANTTNEDEDEIPL